MQSLYPAIIKMRHFVALLLHGTSLAHSYQQNGELEVETGQWNDGVGVAVS
jgi:hypothetical protein